MFERRVLPIKMASKVLSFSERQILRNPCGWQQIDQRCEHWIGCQYHGSLRKHGVLGKGELTLIYVCWLVIWILLPFRFKLGHALCDGLSTPTIRKRTAAHVNRRGSWKCRYLVVIPWLLQVQTIMVSNAAVTPMDLHVGEVVNYRDYLEHRHTDPSSRLSSRALIGPKSFASPLWRYFEATGFRCRTWVCS